ncbi:unnamed protein product [Nippostrongylus brasiliensis]|uniref:GST N-terminal domain-containing protein n=1 Tax=Nippostrongylus brasiliensis TaxID=27835 RepID=A0A0N4YM97_NIPBR|nr:unnamed protein product [Nippostrongylus brasiliensis]
MVKYKLTYFNGRGLAEAARQLFILADQEYEDVRLTREEFAALKPNLPFGQVPVLEIDGHEIAQSKTICRYLANIFGFAGKDAVESAIIDSLADQWTDFDYEIRPWLFITLGYIDGDAEKLKKEILLPARDKFLGFITKFLKNNAGSGRSPHEEDPTGTENQGVVSEASNYVILTASRHLEVHFLFTVKMSCT